MTSRRTKFGVFAFLLSAVLMVCGTMVGREILSRQKEKEDFEQFVQMVTVKRTPTSVPSDSPPASNAPEEMSTPQPEPVRDLSQLFAMNKDFVGWLCIPDTDINYPVMHTPDDPERYLRRNFDGEYSESGVPFLDFRCSLDSDNLIFYGHNMMNGTMFTGLREYVQKTSATSTLSLSFRLRRCAWAWTAHLLVTTTHTLAAGATCHDGGSSEVPNTKTAYWQKNKHRQ